MKIGEVNYQVYYNNEIVERKSSNMDKRTSNQGIRNQKDVFISGGRLDTEFVNDMREFLPKSFQADNYLYELWKESGNYVKTVRENQGSYGFDDVVEGAAVAYSSLYQKIVEGHRNGTRELYVLEDAKSAKWRSVTMDEELEKLEKGFEELIAWDQMVAKSRMQCAINRERFQGVELEDILKTTDIDQASEYIEETYLEFRSCFQKEYEEKGSVVDVRELVSSILQRGKNDMHHYCRTLFQDISKV